MEGDDRGPLAAHRPAAPDLHGRRLARLRAGRGALRRLGPADAAAFRALRLEALRGEPRSFGASWEEEAGQSLDWFAARLEREFVLAAGDPLLGMAGVSFETAAKRRHIAHLWGVYVRPEARGAGHARALLAAAIEAARGRADWIHLGVGIANMPARRLYEAAGFEAYGIERAGLRVDGEDVDEALMALRLSAPG